MSQKRKQPKQKDANTSQVKQKMPQFKLLYLEDRVWLQMTCWRQKQPSFTLLNRKVSWRDCCFNIWPSQVKQESTISKLDPTLEDGSLRVGGRLSKAAMPEKTKHPIIFSKDQHVASSMLKHIHEQMGHAGRTCLSHSDNGTNFTGAEVELREALAHSKIQVAFLQEEVKWSFKPSATSHHGGVWECIIKMDFDIGVTSADFERWSFPYSSVWSPSHSKWPGTSHTQSPAHSEKKASFTTWTEKDYLKRRWRQVQYIADLCRKRWLREYLPLLQQHQTWNKERRGHCAYCRSHNPTQFLVT